MRETVLGLLVFLLLISTVSSYSGDYMSLSWNYTLPEVISDMDVADLDGDGDSEIIVSASSSGELHALDYYGERLWRYRYPGYLHSTSAGDLDVDGKKEVFAGTGESVHKLNQDGEYQRKSSTNRMPAKMIRFSDLDSNGVQELIVGSYDLETCQDNFFHVFKDDGSTMWSPYNLGYSVPFVVASGELGDENYAFVGLVFRSKSTGKKSCPPSYNAPGKVLVLDKDKKLAWQYETEGGVTSILVSELEGDGSEEVLVGTYPYLYVFSRQGKLKWKYEGLSLIHDVTTADLDGDGGTEVLVVSDNLYVLDAQGNHLWTGLTEDRAYSVTSADLDGDGRLEAIVGSNRVNVFSSEGVKLWESDNLVTIDHIFALDVDNDGFQEVVAGAVRRVHYYKTKSFARAMSAEGLMLRARAALEEKDFENALEASQLAIDLYSEVEDLEKLADAINLFNEINRTAEDYISLKSEAEDYLNLAKKHYGSEEFMNATVYARKARELYTNPMIRNPSIMLEMDTISTNSIKVLRREATEYLELAEDFFQQGNKSEAREYALKAKEIYSFLEDEREEAKADRIVSGSTTPRDQLKEWTESVKSIDIYAEIKD
ncbi:FG-GAP-like repeat-containing protein, partial [Candidatus Altiarchaeota archaeon]